MDNHSFKQTSSPERNSSSEHPKEEQVPQAEKLKNEQLSHEVSEMIDDVEGGFETGEVNENVKEGKKKFSGSTSSTSQTTAAKIAKKITPPSLEVMRTQIAVKIKKEIVVLEREAAKIAQGRNFSPFQLNSVVAKIRDLKEILASLSYATLETMKNWWFKYVKGITSSS